jgi:hypothetical protein
MDAARRRRERSPVSLEYGIWNRWGCTIFDRFEEEIEGGRLDCSKAMGLES